MSIESIGNRATPQLPHSTAQDAEVFGAAAENEQQFAFWATAFQLVAGALSIRRNIVSAEAGLQLQDAVRGIRYGAEGSAPVVRNDNARTGLAWAANGLSGAEWPRVYGTEEGASFQARVIRATAPNGRVETVELRPGEVLIVSPIENSERGDYAFAIFAEEDLGRRGAIPREAGIYNPDWVTA